jgi:hypothetical protein
LPCLSLLAGNSGALETQRRSFVKLEFSVGFHLETKLGCGRGGGLGCNWLTGKGLALSSGWLFGFRC